jgi:predicted component of type VI protein secretion system
MARLIFIGDKFAGRVYELAVENTTVGRGDHNTLTIHDASVSHSHCEILLHGPEVIVRDLGSRNGTMVNGVRLRNQQRPLLSGQTVQFGTVEARLELETPSTSDTVTDLTAVYSHARHLREQQEQKAVTTASVILEGGAPSAGGDQTLVLPHAPESPPKPKPPTVVAGKIAGKPGCKISLVLIAATFGLGLAALLWLILVD